MREHDRLCFHVDFPQSDPGEGDYKNHSKINFIHSLQYVYHCSYNGTMILHVFDSMMVVMRMMLMMMMVMVVMVIRMMLMMMMLMMMMAMMVTT